MLKALLFDLDGTLADTDPIHYENWRAIMERFGITIDPPYYKAQFSGRLNEKIISDMLPQLSLEEGRQLSDYKEEQFREQATRLQPMAGLLELLDWMEFQDLKRAVVTNAPLENAQFMLRVLKLEAVFPIVILGEALPRGKPDPLPYQAALARLGVVPEEAIAFEDSGSGVRSAVGAGIPTVGVASSQSPEQLYEWGAKLAIADFTEPPLWDWLKQAVFLDTK